MPNERQILMQNSHSRFDVTENPLSDCILLYNSCGIACYSLEDIGAY